MLPGFGADSLEGVLSGTWAKGINQETSNRVKDRQV